MPYLLDTQIFIWSLEDNPKLKTSFRLLIEDPQNIIYVSQLSLMEISIKLKLGNLPDFIVTIEIITEQLVKDGFTLLPLSNAHIFSYQSVPFFEEHRDPFDRFLLATAISEEIPIISNDEKFSLYKNLVHIIQ